MSRKLVLFYMALSCCLGLAQAQDSIECQTKLSNFHEDTKAKRYDKAYDDWLYVKTECPSLSLAIYSHGEKILRHKIENPGDTPYLSYVKDLLALWNDRAQYFSDRTPTGQFAAKACQLRYDFKDDLDEDTLSLFSCFNEAFKTDTKTFRHPKSLYTYFSLTVDLYDSGNKSASDLFNIYDDVNEKIELEIQNYSEKLNKLIQKVDSGVRLTGSEERKRSAYESYLKNYSLVRDNINAIIITKGSCDDLVPLYTREFEIHKNDSIWLKRAVSRLYRKDCSKEMFYETIVKQYDEVAPSFDTKIFVATMLLAKGKDEEAFEYLEEAYTLFTTSPYKKSKLAFRIAIIYKSKHQYAKARNYLLEALKLNPADGRPHLIIAHMYDKSAKNCGKDSFYKRAVFWLAAEEAKKASRVDPTLKKLAIQSEASYIAKAPSKEDVFLRGLGGKTIKIECWINRSVVVPKP